MILIILILAICFWSIFTHLLFRNNSVYKFRMKILSEESDFWSKNIPNSIENLYRFEGGYFPGFRCMNMIPSYNSMVLKFWKPVTKKSFGIKEIKEYYPELEGKKDA